MSKCLCVPMWAAVVHYLTVQAVGLLLGGHAPVTTGGQKLTEVRECSTLVPAACLLIFPIILRLAALKMLLFYINGCTERKPSCLYMLGRSIEELDLATTALRTRPLVTRALHCMILKIILCSSLCM